MVKRLRLTWGEPAASAYYCLQNLSPQDARRATQARHAGGQADWKVSRALLHAGRATAAPGCAESLSHSRGHALVAHAASAGQLGVDLERFRPRRALALGEWSCSVEEMAIMRELIDPQRLLQCFYTLWTLKEAFIKAAGLSFPADLRLYGLDKQEDGSLTLRAPPGVWHARTYALGTEWVASVVWASSSSVVDAEPLWVAGPASNLPRITLLGNWTCG